MTYAFLEAYRRGELPSIWSEFRTKLIENDPKLSPIRAGEIAAAQIATYAANELANFEHEESLDDADFDLLNWLIDHYSINADLVTLSGTRTLIADMHIYPLPLELTSTIH